MTKEEAIEYLNTLYMALAVFPNQQISLGNVDEMKKSVNMAIKALEQEPKTGNWIEVIDEIDSLGNETWHHKCSICGNEKSGWGNYKYCPNCGAKMKVDE